MKRVKNFLLALPFFLVPGLLLAQTETATTSADIAAEILGSAGLMDNAILIFNSVVTVVLAVVALGILITMVKKVRRG